MSKSRTPPVWRQQEQQGAQKPISMQREVKDEKKGWWGKLVSPCPPSDNSAVRRDDISYILCLFWTGIHPKSVIRIQRSHDLSTSISASCRLCAICLTFSSTKSRHWEMQSVRKLAYTYWTSFVNTRWQQLSFFKDVVSGNIKCLEDGTHLYNSPTTHNAIPPRTLNQATDLPKRHKNNLSMMLLRTGSATSQCDWQSTQEISVWFQAARRYSQWGINCLLLKQLIKRCQAIQISHRSRLQRETKTLHVFSSAFHAVFPWQLATVSSHCNGAHSISMTQVGKLSRLLESCLQMGNVDNWPLVRDGKKIPLHLLTISMTSAVVGMAIVTTETGPRTTDVARWIAKLTNLPIQCHFLKRIILFLMARRALFQHPIKGSYNWNPVWFFRFQSLIKKHWNSPVQAGKQVCTHFQK